MNRTLIISESQKKFIIKESIIDKITETINNGYDYALKVLSEVKESYGLNFEFLITWGASIGGLMGPINDFIQGKYPELTEVEMSLILTGIISIHYLDNKKDIEKVLLKIKSEGLEESFKYGLDKSKELKSTLIRFLHSLNLTFFSVTKIISYAFIIPILLTIVTMVKENQIKPSDVKEISQRIAGSGVVSFSGIMLRDLFTKLINRFNYHP